MTSPFPSPHFPPSLTISTLRARAVNPPLSSPHYTASGPVLTAPLVLLDLETREGITGRSYVFCYTSAAAPALASLLSNLESLIAGDILAPVHIEQKLQKRFRLLGPQGLVGIALAAIDMAAWDALARALQLPLCRLLGGHVTPVPAYKSLGMSGPDGAATDTAAAVEEGFSAIKFKVGYPDVAADLAVVRAARDAAAGAITSIMVDYNQSLSVPAALKRAELLKCADVAWIEEPTTAEDFAGHAKIRDESDTPIQMGENWWGTRDMVKAIQAGASDYVMIDVMKIGGVTGWLRAAALAEIHGLPLSTHLFPEISAHLLTTTPTAHWLEYQDWADPILQNPLRPKAGCVTPSDGPGIGLDWDEAAVQKYQLS